MHPALYHGPPTLGQPADGGRPCRRHRPVVVRAVVSWHRRGDWLRWHRSLGGRSRSPDRTRGVSLGSCVAGTARAGTARAGTARAGTARAGTARAGTARAGTARAGTARAGAIRAVAD